MTKQEILNEMAKWVKPYNQISPPMPQPTYSATMKAIRYGFCKPETERLFFSRFGIRMTKEPEYEITNPIV